MQFLGLDMSVDKNKIAFEPAVSLRDGIREYLECYENN